jgi:hypothetical protein
MMLLEEPMEMARRRFGGARTVLRRACVMEAKAQ